MKQHQEKIWFWFDEARFGTHSKIGYGWFPKGKRTSIKIKLGFQNFYVYTAIRVDRGEHFSLIMPYVNGICMNIFLQKLSKRIGKRKAVLVMDQAGWHKGKELIVPSNIMIIYLPPYSPELNPVERFWEHTQANVLKNKIYSSFDSLEATVCNFINSISRPEIKSLCAYNLLN